MKDKTYSISNLRVQGDREWIRNRLSYEGSGEANRPPLGRS